MEPILLEHMTIEIVSHTERKYMNIYANIWQIYVEYMLHICHIQVHICAYIWHICPIYSIYRPHICYRQVHICTYMTRLSTYMPHICHHKIAYMSYFIYAMAHMSPFYLQINMTIYILCISIQ